MKPIRIPREKVSDVREALLREQKHVPSKDRVRYSMLHETFYKFERLPSGRLCHRQCSRDGKKLGKLFGAPFGPLPATRLVFNPEGATGGSWAPRRRVPSPEPKWPEFHILLNPELPMKLTPMHISLLCHHAEYSEAPLAPRGCEPHPYAVRQAQHDLVKAGLIDLKEVSSRATLTEKGRVFVEHLLKQPLPIEVSTPKWKVPS